MSDQGRLKEVESSDRTLVERIDPMLGSIIDKRYHVDFRLAAGGFGAIYKATHIKSGHEVALKVLHREMATDPRVVARFRREGEALTSLRDPHTITAYEIGEAADGALYIVMELLHGESLYERFRGRGPLTWQQVVRIGHAICSSLAEAHARGIVHRDLKPANIHLEPRPGEPDYVKVLDFGIAKILNGGDNNADLTNAGQMIGTFDYMSPEQMVGDCTTRSDIYTLGVLMYEMICGVRPFDDVAGPTSLLAALITRAPPPLASRADVPAELNRIVMRCLEKEPATRYQDVLDLQRDLDRLMPASVPPSGDDDATRAIQLPIRPSMLTPSTPAVDHDVTWRGENAPIMLTPDSGFTPQMAKAPTPTPALTPTPSSAPTPTPIYKPVPQQPPPMYPVSASIAPGERVAMPAAMQSVPPPIQGERGSAPVMYPAGAYHAAGMQPQQMQQQQMPPPPSPYQRPPTPPPWDQMQQQPLAPPPRLSQVEVRPFDMSAATSRDAWVGRIIWAVVILIAVVLIAVVMQRL